MAYEPEIEVIGYIRYPNTDWNEYWDFVRAKLRFLDVVEGLEHGIFPPGLVLKDRKGTVAIVNPDRRSLRKFNLWENRT